MSFQYGRFTRADRMTDIVDGEPTGEVWTDKYSWVWHSFEVTDKLLSVYLMSYMKTKGE